MIRQATVEDFKEICQINSENFRHPWNVQQVKDELNKEGSINLVLEADKHIVAYLFATQIEYEYEIITLAVSKANQRRGLGSNLINELFNNAEKRSTFFLEVSHENKKAISFYESHDFKQISQRDSYYRDGSTALIMRKTV